MPGGPRGARRTPAIGCRTPPLHPQVACSSLSSGFLPQYNDRCCHAASLSDEPEFDGETWRQYITDNHDEPDRQSGHQWRRCLSCIFGLFITERYSANPLLSEAQFSGFSGHPKQGGGLLDMIEAAQGRLCPRLRKQELGCVDTERTNYVTVQEPR